MGLAVHVLRYTIRTFFLCCNLFQPQPLYWWGRMDLNHRAFGDLIYSQAQSTALPHPLKIIRNRPAKTTRPGVLFGASGPCGLDLSVYRVGLLFPIRDAFCCRIPIAFITKCWRANGTKPGRRAEHGRQGAQGHGYRLPLGCPAGDGS